MDFTKVPGHEHIIYSPGTFLYPAAGPVVGCTKCMEHRSISPALFLMLDGERLIQDKVMEFAKLHSHETEPEVLDPSGVPLIFPR